MKIICKCGNEMIFVEDDLEDEYGQYTKTDGKKFEFWAEHEKTGVVCQKCDKAIWYFA